MSYLKVRLYFLKLNYNKNEIYKNKKINILELQLWQLVHNVLLKHE